MLSELLHDVEHRGRVETLQLSVGDMSRRRVRGITDAGTDCAIALPRDQTLDDGAVILLEPDRAIVVRSEDRRWLRLSPASVEDALSLGYLAGNLHWRVQFVDRDLMVELDGPVDRYLARLRPLIDTARITVEGHDHAA